MKKILVPVDFSDTSLSALSYAIRLFEGSPLAITVLHSYQVASSAFSMKSIDGFVEDDAQKEMDTLIKRVEGEHPNVVLIPKIVKGNAVSIITSMGDSGDYDFVIMGTKGASGLKEVFIGSVAGGVISKTQAPVLVVPADYTYQPLDEIVFAISDTMFSNVEVVDPLRKLAKMCSCKVNVLHISKDEKPDLKEIVSTIDDLNPVITYSFGTGHINERLNEYLQQEGSKLLCLIRSKRGFFNRIFDESVTLKQTFNSVVPLLVLHDE
jgi:nucleotide-binding universal stress UspA family protein